MRKDVTTIGFPFCRLELSGRFDTFMIADISRDCIEEFTAPGS
jgi:hypothetical protein